MKFGQNWPGRLGEDVLRICLHTHTHECLYRYLFEDLDFYVVFEDPIKTKEFPCRKMSEHITIARK